MRKTGREGSTEWVFWLYKMHLYVNASPGFPKPPPDRYGAFCDARLTGWRDLRALCIGKMKNDVDRAVLREHNIHVFGDEIGPNRAYFERATTSEEAAPSDVGSLFQREHF